MASAQVIPFASRRREVAAVKTQVGISIDAAGRVTSLTTRIEPLHVLAVLGFALRVAQNALDQYIEESTNG